MMDKKTCLELPMWCPITLGRIAFIPRLAVKFIHLATAKIKKNSANLDLLFWRQQKLTHFTRNLGGYSSCYGFLWIFMDFRSPKFRSSRNLPLAPAFRQTLCRSGVTLFCLPVGLVHRFVSKKLVYSCGFWNLGPNTQNSWFETTLLNNTVKLDHLSGFPGEQLKKIWSHHLESIFFQIWNEDDGFWKEWRATLGMLDISGMYLTRLSHEYTKIWELLRFKFRTQT